MTCQWCVHYRRRGGVSLCAEPSRDGSTMPVKDGGKCEKFTPRRNCTTCCRRCSQDEKSARQDKFGYCSEWTMRILSTWGGKRAARWKSRRSSEGSENNDKKKEDK